jgi:hypothetical protein
VIVIALIGQGGLELARDDGGVARSTAGGLLVVTAAVLGARYRSPGGVQRAPGTAAAR